MKEMFKMWGQGFYFIIEYWYISIPVGILLLIASCWFYYKYIAGVRPGI